MLNWNNQNSINYTGFQIPQTIKDKQIFEQFVNKDGHVTCDSPRGYLVNETPVQSFVSSIKDTGKDVSNLGKALISGKANDSQLGRMNDLGMKIGGGLIAAAIMAKKNTTGKKFMELAGFGTFFSVMSLWPKAAIDLPTKLRYGFNPHQKYVDSNGTKKQFFLDNQYLPWDIWPKEDINAIADKMNVPADLADREEYTKEKMRTVALQGNTLWMLTAGFSTPLLTSLICNRIENAADYPIAHFDLNKAAKDAGSLDNLVEKTLANKNLFKAQDAEFEELMGCLRKGELPENFAQRLADIFDISAQTDYKPLKDSLRRDNLSSAQDIAQKLFAQKKDFSALAKELAGNEGDEAVKQAGALFNEAHSLAKLKDGEVTLERLMNTAKGLIDQHPDKYTGEWVDMVYGDIALPKSVKEAVSNGQIGYDKTALKNGADSLEKIYTKSIKPAQAELNVFGKITEKLDGVSGIKYNKAAKKMVEVLGFSDKEIEAIRNEDRVHGSFIQDLITDKIKAIANDDIKYQNALQELTKESERIENAKQIGSGEKISVKSVFEKISNGISDRLKSCGGAIKQDDLLQNSKLSCVFERGLNDAEIQGARRNITSVESMVNRLYNSIEVERRIQSGSLLEDWKGFVKQNGYSADALIPDDEALQDFYTACRKAALQANYGDTVNKFYTFSNGDYFKALCDTVYSGAADNTGVKEWRNAAKSIALETAFIPNESQNFSEVSSAYGKLMNDYLNVHPNERGHVSKEVVEKLRKQAIDETGLSGEIFKSDALKFADYGEATFSVIKKQADKMYVDKKWLKIFGGLTVALAGVTLVSQLFFGKVKDSHLYRKKDAQDSFVPSNLIQNPTAAGSFESVNK